MRRPLLALIALATLAAACATPRITLERRYRAGEVRTYRLTAESTATLETGRERRTDHTVLEADSRIEVVRVAGDEVRLRVRLTPRRLVRDGETVQAPEPQEAEVVLAPDGSVRSVAAVGGVPADVTDVAEVAPLLSTPFPPGRVRIGDTWQAEAPGPGEQAARHRGLLETLRVIDGYDAAILVLDVRRPIVRARRVGDVELELRGQEVSAVEVAFAFREGLPVRIDSASEGAFEVSGVAGPRGTIELETTTSLRLTGRRAP